MVQTAPNKFIKFISMEEYTIKEIISRPYQQRSIHQHKAIIDLLSHHFFEHQLKYSYNTIKIMTFYIQLVEGQKWILGKQYKSQTIILTNLNAHPTNLNQQAFHLIYKDTKIYIDKNKYALILNHDDILTSQHLRQSSIEHQISYFQSLQWFQNIIRKKIYSLFRNSTIKAYKLHDRVFQENEEVDVENGAVYLVRSGEFLYSKYSPSQKKSLEIFRFTEGQIFGTFQLIKLDCGKRLFSVVCCSSKAVVYKFTSSQFLNSIKPFSQSLVITQLNLLKYLRKSVESLNNTMVHQKQLIRNYHQRSYSSAGLQQPTTPSLPFISKQKKSQLTTSKDSKQRTTLNPQNRTQSFKNLQIKNSSQSNKDNKDYKQDPFNELDKLIETKQKFMRIKKIMKQGCGKGRQQILFGLFKTSWQFEKSKKVFKRKSLF